MESFEKYIHEFVLIFSESGENFCYQKRCWNYFLKIICVKKLGNDIIEVIIIVTIRWNTVWATVVISHIRLQRINSTSFCDNIQGTKYILTRSFWQILNSELGEQQLMKSDSC